MNWINESEEEGGSSYAHMPLKPYFCKKIWWRVLELSDSTKNLQKYTEEQPHEGAAVIAGSDICQRFKFV